MYKKFEFEVIISKCLVISIFEALSNNKISAYYIKMWGYQYLGCQNLRFLY